MEFLDCNKLAELFREFFNNYLTVEKFAGAHDLNLDDARAIIEAGKLIHNTCAELNKKLNK